MRYKYFKIITLSIYTFLYCCVEPPEYDDGLLTNVPAIVNESDYFSLSINAENYSKSHSWDLSFNAVNTDTLYTSLVIKDYTVSLNDSTYIRLYNSNNATIFDILINQEATTIDDIAVEYIGNPNRLVFTANKFNGRIDLQLIKQ